ncbi:related to sphingoid long chain base kinase 4 [Phialocephala subalpina]|uniref:Related to sphingoid long chain base kinase 4 n=1 Tax=Phialocephala subalpina TaxID=576137 RepID=A0A1L7XNX8_9HELO|nr:related to sphingoid long chain base kinase 4 [Phialocephala subalpina]
MGSQQKKRAKVLVNPHGGQGKIRSISEAWDLDAFDMAVVCSGDGLTYEVFNELGKSPDARKVLSMIAVADIPCGSGNGLSHNLNGTGIASIATLAIIKVLRKPLDLISITQGDTRTLSSWPRRRAWGQKVIWLRAFTVDGRRSVQTRIRDKDFDEGGTYDGLPRLKYGTIKGKTPEDWVVIPCDNLGILYCGNLAYMSADTKYFPPALHNGGLMDLVLIDGNIRRRASFKLFDALKDETLFDLPVVKYHKISAYRWIPRNQDSGYISVDGESIQFEPYRAEIHKGLGTVHENDQIAGASPSL